MPTPPYAELHCRSAFSFLDGASAPAELVERALEMGLSALAITDRNGLYGIVEAREGLLEACGLTRREEDRARLKLIYGSELSFDHGGESDGVVALVGDRQGYAGLCGAISRGRLAAEKGSFRLRFQDLAERGRGLWILAGGPRSAAMRHLTAGDPERAERNLSALREAFGDRLRVELVRHLAPGDRERSLAMAALARHLGIPVVASNDVHFHVRERKILHDLLRCIEGGHTLAAAGRRLLPNAEPHLKPGAEMARLFADLPEAIEEGMAVAGAVRFRLGEVRYGYPLPDLPPGDHADGFLARLAREGLRARLGEKVAAQHRAQLEKELALIAELRFAGYFITMWEIIETCRARNILCQGRGSAANSLVCFALGITSVPPDAIDMLFERFISRERQEPPDIDLDIEHERREEIIQHVYRKYGRERAAMVAEVIRYQWRSALRDVGKALGFSDQQLLRMSRFLTHRFEELDVAALRAVGIDPAGEQGPALKTLLTCAQALAGMPRHLSIHVGGFVLSQERLDEIVPIENGRMAERTVIQWNKDDVDAMGMFKLDLLGLGMLTVLAKAFALVRAERGVSLGLQTVPAEDPATFAMLKAADSVGVFQVESRAQMNMLPRLQPETFYDLVIEVAIVRPGPIQGKMVHPFLRRRRGIEKVEYPHPKLRAILHKTKGVPLFQEQVMRLAEAVGGYTPGEADQLRRDMGSWRADGRMERHRERLIAGMLGNGLSRDYAERIYQQILGFGAYGFPESHAAAFAHLAYLSAYLKCHYPVEFACALLNAQPMGFYSPSTIVSDLKRHRRQVLPVDVQRSDWDCTIEGGALRLGLRMVRGLGEEAGRRLVAARAAGPFRSVEDLGHRAGMPSRALVPLAASGALASLHTRRQAIWAAAAAARPVGGLFAGQRAEGGAPALPLLAPLSPMQTLAMDAQYAGAFPERHPMELIRPRLSRQGVLRAADVLSAVPDSTVRVAGLVIVRQRPQTASGVVFLALEDETGQVDVSLSAGAFRRFQSTIRLCNALLVRGRLLADGAARTVSANNVAALRLDAPRVASHDFH
jgi:error-prone DNA polymerase